MHLKKNQCLASAAVLDNCSWRSSTSRSLRWVSRSKSLIPKQSRKGKGNLSWKYLWHRSGFLWAGIPNVTEFIKAIWIGFICMYIIWVLYILQRHPTTMLIMSGANGLMGLWPQNGCLSLYIVLGILYILLKHLVYSSERFIYSSDTSNTSTTW